MRNTVLGEYLFPVLPPSLQGPQPQQAREGNFAEILNPHFAEEEEFKSSAEAMPMSVIDPATEPTPPESKLERKTARSLLCRLALRPSFAQLPNPGARHTRRCFV